MTVNNAPIASTNEIPVLLMVEDDEADAFLIKKQVLSIWEKSQVIIAESLQEAHQIFKDQKISVLLLDLNLPDGAGAHTVAEVRRFNRNTPIIVISGMCTDGMIEDAIKYGAAAVIRKSELNTQRFIRVLEEVVA